MRLKLPDSQRADIEREKITGYLLNPNHPDGGSKADFFSRFGFSRDDWQVLAEALISHGATHEVVETQRTRYGVKYTVIGDIDAPDGRSPQVKTVWQIDDGDDQPRLVTAHPLT